jgi:hypothetical protein
MQEGNFGGVTGVLNISIAVMASQGASWVMAHQIVHVVYCTSVTPL